MESLLLIERGPFRRILVYPTGRAPGRSNYCISLSSVGSVTNETQACKIDMLTAETVDVSAYENLAKEPIFGCLGLVRIASDDFLCVVTAIAHVGIIHGKNLYRIERVEFVSINSPKYDGLGIATATISLSSDDATYSRRSPQQGFGHPCADLASLLSEGTFYFGYDWDSTKNFQRTCKSSTKFSWWNCEPSFFWNHFWMRPIKRFAKPLPPTQQEYLQSEGLFVACFAGFADVNDLNFGTDRAAFAVISRISCKRAGTRFRSRGIDDDGNVSNFVETETLFAHPDYTFSHIIIRGTVPVFWDQQGFQLGFPRIQITRTPAATQPSFDRHIGNLRESYGLVHIVDLLCRKEGQAESVLSNAFEFHARKFPEVGVLSHTSFDVYSVCKSSNFERLDSLFHLIGQDLHIFGYFVIDSNRTIIREQKGIFRVNCLDCLDRTNMVQNYIVKRTVDLFLRNYLPRAGTYPDTLTELWSANGDQLSRIYTGSNAIKSSYGRLSKFTLSSFVEDFKNTAKRFYSNNFNEKNRQQAIDIFLGKSARVTVVAVHSSHSDLVGREMAKRRPEFCDQERIVVQVLTWNTNAALPVADEDYSPLISLSKVDPERRILWEGIILRHLNERHPKALFSHLVSHQLVGTTLSIFVRSDHLDSVRSVEIASKKTGMGGMAGNKGSVAVRLDVFGSSFCFVSSHFTAGQSNSNERDRDMLYALNDLQMSGGRDILAHDFVFWCGDLNYRIEMDGDLAREFIREKNFEGLKEYDQLNLHMSDGLVFQGFKEAEMAFAPTYKYDVGTNIYDTSEKMRVPSYTDRILFRGDLVEPLLYDRAEIDTSDHKPVKGAFEVVVLKVDPERERKMRATIKKELGLLPNEEDGYLCLPIASLFSVGSTPDLIELGDALPEIPPSLPPRPNIGTT